MPSIKSLLAEIRDELDSRQIVVSFKLTHLGVEIHSEDYASKLIARHELQRNGIIEAAVASPTRPNPIPCTSDTHPR